MAKGWVIEDNMSEEEIVRRRKETTEEYQKEIESLKEQELSLQASVDNLKKTIDDANSARTVELQLLEDSLKSKISDTENLIIKNRELKVTYEKSLADMAKEVDTFNRNKLEKEAELESRLKDLGEKEAVLAGKTADHEVNVLKISNDIESHEENVQSFNKEAGLIHDRKVEALSIKVSADETLAKIAAEKDYNQHVLDDIQKIKLDYDAKNSALDVERESLKTLKVEYTEKIVRLNAEKESRNAQMVQMKLDRAELDKRFDELSTKQLDINTQMEKLAALNAQVIKES